MAKYEVYRIDKQNYGQESLLSKHNTKAAAKRRIANAKKAHKKHPHLLKRFDYRIKELVPQGLFFGR